MKKILLLFLVLSINIGLFSQSKDTIYYNSNWELANSSEHDYYIIKEGNRKNGAYTTYYITGEIRSNFYCNEINYEDILKSKFASAPETVNLFNSALTAQVWFKFNLVKKPKVGWVSPDTKEGDKSPQ